MWLKASAPEIMAGLKKLEKTTDAEMLRAALDASAAAIGELLRAGLAGAIEDEFCREADKFLVCGRRSTPTLRRLPDDRDRRTVVDAALARARTIRPDGSWTDIDCANKAASNWGPADHASRLNLIARAYA